MITLSKFAKLAHVSVSTASKAFAMSGEVNEQTREEIFKLAKKLGCFKKFYNAKYPKFVVAVICPEFQSQYYSRTLSLIQGYLAESNCDVCAASTDFSVETEKMLLDYYNNYTNVDAIIVVEGQVPIDDSYETPVISICPFVSQKHTITVNIDYETSMFEILEYFKSKGVDSVGYLGEKNTPEKLDAFENQMLKTYGAYDKELEIVTESRFEMGGYKAMEELLQKEKLPRALICAYDYFAIGAIRCLLDHGLSVPEDMAIVGIDNIPVARYLNPPLTSISSRREVMCKTATDAIIKLLHNEGVEQEVTINSRLHMRKSSEII